MRSSLLTLAVSLSLGASTLLTPGPAAASAWQATKRLWSADNAKAKRGATVPPGTPATLAPPKSRYSSAMIAELDRLASKGPSTMSGPSLRLGWAAVQRGSTAAQKYRRATDPTLRESLKHEALECMYVVDIIRRRMREANFSHFLNGYQEGQIVQAGKDLEMTDVPLALAFHELHPELEAPPAAGVKGLAPRQMK